MRNFVRLPTTNAEVTSMQHGFYEIAHFPGVIGCIDGSHVSIENPGGANAEVFRNRKGRFSINCQVYTYYKYQKYIQICLDLHRSIRTVSWLSRIHRHFNPFTTIGHELTRFRRVAGGSHLACTQQTHCGMHASIFSHTQTTTRAGSLGHARVESGRWNNR